MQLLTSNFYCSSLGAGLIFLPLLLPSVLAPLVGKYSDVRGPRLPVILGFLLGTPFVILLMLVDSSGTRQIALLCALLTLVGLSYPMAITAILAEYTYTVDAEEMKRGEGCFGEMGAYAQAVSFPSILFFPSLNHHHRYLPALPFSFSQSEIRAAY